MIDGGAAGARESAADRRALDLVARGDDAGIGELYDRYGRSIFALAIRIVTDAADAEEVVQDVFTQVWRQSARYDVSRASVAGWLLMMTRARAIDRLRARRARPDTRAEEMAPCDAPVVEATQEILAIDGQHVRALMSALVALPETLRTPIELAYYEGLSHAEISERLQTPLGTVKTRMRSALMKLRTVLHPDGEA